MKRVTPDEGRIEIMSLVAPVAAVLMAGVGLLAAAFGVGAIELVIGVSLLTLLVGVLALASLLQGYARSTRSRAALESAEHTIRILDRAHEAYIAVDPDGVLTAWNAAAEATFGWTREEALGRPVAELIVPEQERERLRRGFERFRRTGEGPLIGPRIEGIALHRDGTKIPVELSITALEEGDDYSLHAFLRDITERRMLEAEQAERLDAAKKSARIDPLTKLPNRRGWDETLVREMSRARREHKPLCVALLDLDFFKAFNDTHGHQEGDELLRRSASAWKLAVRGSDIIARYGGEEFAVLLPACALDEALDVIERLRESTPGGQTVSAGVAEWDGAEPQDALIDRADLALYNAKRSGRDQSIAA